MNKNIALAFFLLGVLNTAPSIADEGGNQAPVMACIFDTTEAFPSTRINPVSLTRESLIHAIRALFFAPKTGSVKTQDLTVELARRYIDGLDAGSIGHAPFTGMPRSYDLPATNALQGHEALTGEFIFSETSTSANQWEIVIQKDLAAARISSTSILSKTGTPLAGLCAPCTEENEDYCDVGWAFP